MVLVAQVGQMTKSKLVGIGRMITDGVSEGQFSQSNGNSLNGFGRKIDYTGKFHIGWFKDDHAHGFGIGDLYTAKTGVKIGYYHKKEDMKWNDRFLD